MVIAEATSFLFSKHCVIVPADGVMDCVVWTPVRRWHLPKNTSCGGIDRICVCLMLPKRGTLASQAMGRAVKLPRVSVLNIKPPGWMEGQIWVKQVHAVAPHVWAQTAAPVGIRGQFSGHWGNDPGKSIAASAHSALLAAAS